MWQLHNEYYSQTCLRNFCTSGGFIAERKLKEDNPSANMFCCLYKCWGGKGMRYFNWSVKVRESIEMLKYYLIKKCKWIFKKKKKKKLVLLNVLKY